jgi:hypothetical protein
LLGSTFVSMQNEPHSVVPPPQLSEHCPLEHTWPLVHALPQEPQWAGSTLMATQTPPQSVCPAGHPPASLGASVVLLGASVAVSLGASEGEAVSAPASPVGCPPPSTWAPSLDASPGTLAPGDEEQAGAATTAPMASASRRMKPAAG